MTNLEKIKKYLSKRKDATPREIAKGIKGEFNTVRRILNENKRSYLRSGRSIATKGLFSVVGERKCKVGGRDSKAWRV